jgi:1-deoxy-D-xylulose-5-phosphate reductoisomerase
MGPKITIDSATLMNKGFEVIEACWLFGLEPSQVRVVVHPQSTIHSLVEFEDGSFLAQLGVTDMRIPIQYALTFPERLSTGLTPLDLSRPLTLDFHPPDLERFACLRLAYDAIETGGTAPAVLNAANEVAVRAYLDERIGFLQIPGIVAETLTHHDPQGASDLETVLAADEWARREARRRVSASSPSRQE